MKILGLFPSFDEIGGIQVSGELAWRAISGCGDHERQLISYGRHARPRGTARADGVVEVDSKLAAGAAALLSRRPVDLVLIWHLNLLRLLPLVGTSRARTFVFLHGIEAWRPLDWPTRLAARKLGGFLTNSDHTWDRFIASNPQFGGSAQQTVPLGIGTPAQGGAPCLEEPPAALMLGRLPGGERYKGHHEVIRSWAGVLRQMPDARLWVVGDGAARPDLEVLATQCGVAERVRFFGEVDEKKKQELLQRCRCLALPSRGEGFGLVYLEAMRYGKPCLVSNLDAGREVVNPPECGLAADPDDSDALVTALTRLLTPGAEWDAWSERARARYEASFTARHFSERLLAALELAPHAPDGA